MHTGIRNYVFQMDMCCVLNIRGQDRLFIIGRKDQKKKGEKKDKEGKVLQRFRLMKASA